jgi:hypothetical protein
MQEFSMPVSQRYSQMLRITAILIDYVAYLASGAPPYALADVSLAFEVWAKNRKLPLERACEQVESAGGEFVDAFWLVDHPPQFRAMLAGAAVDFTGFLQEHHPFHDHLQSKLIAWAVKWRLPLSEALVLEWDLEKSRYIHGPHNSNQDYETIIASAVADFFKARYAGLASSFLPALY